MSYIHPTAVVSQHARIGKQVHIGPYCIVEDNVILEDHAILHSHVVVTGFTTVGAYTEIFPFASIGHRPQDLKYKGEHSVTVIGTHNIIREYVTIQPGTKHGGLRTVIGNHNLFMGGVHIAHDCALGDRCVIANQGTLAGHVTVGSDVVIGGLSAIKQFVHIGDHAMISGMVGIRKNVLPFGYIGPNALLRGINVVGLKRKGFDRQHISELRQAYTYAADCNHAYGATFDKRMQHCAVRYADNPLVQRFSEFYEQRRQDNQGFIINMMQEETHESHAHSTHTKKHPLSWFQRVFLKKIWHRATP